MAGGQFFTFSGLNDGKSSDDDIYGFASRPVGNTLNPLEGAMRPPSQGLFGGAFTGFGGPPGFGGGFSGFGGQPGSQMPASQAGMWGPPGTSGGAPRTVDNRPMSSHRKAGYQATTNQFDPLKQGASAFGPAPPLQKKTADSPEEQCLEMERKVNALIEESAQLSLQRDYPLALEKAKEASKKERLLCKHREQQGLGDQINIDLTYSVHFNLAVQYQKNQLYTEALNTYSLIVRNKQYAQSGRLRVNMGNIYYEQDKTTLAIKMYRLALDQIPNTGKDLKFKIIRNIGNAYVKTGQYPEAINSYEAIMDGNPDIQTGFNLLLCYYATGDKEKLKRHFTKLLSIRKYGSTDDDLEDMMDEVDKESDVFIDDKLRQEIRDRRKQHMETLLTAARLIAPMIEKDWQTGYDYIIDSLRHFELKDASSRLASEMEMAKALTFLKYKKYGKAIDALKAFEKKDRQLKAKAAVNLSYLFFLEGDIENGTKYAELSIKEDRFNAKALVNAANFYYVKQEYERAKEFYTEALTYEADCVEAMYNLGLTTKALGQYEESLRIFKKLQSMIPDSVEVTYQIANLFDLMSDYHSASEWFNRLVSRVPTDPNVLARLGSIYAKEDDESQAFHYHLEAYRYFPVNMDVISWLGAYFVKNEVYEKAMQYFERASQIQPTEVKWQLMVASCHRRIGNYPQARILYEEIHKRFPDNVECLRYLVHICNDTGHKDDAVEYHKKLRRLEQRLATDDYFASPQQHAENGDADGSGERSNTPPNRYEDDDSHTAVPLPTRPAGGVVAGGGGEAGPTRAAEPEQPKKSTAAARINKRQEQQEREMRALVEKQADDDVELDMDEMLPGM